MSNQPPSIRHSSRDLIQRAIVGMALALFIGGGFATATSYWAQQNDYVVIVAGEHIPQVAYQRRLNQTLRMFKDSANLPDNMLSQMVITQLIEKQLWLQEARRRQIDVPESEVESEWQQMLAQTYAGRADRMRAELQRNHYSESAFRRDLHENLQIRKLQELMTAQSKVPEAELQAYYQSHQQEWKQAERIETWHILFKADQSKPDELSKAREQANEILLKLKAGANFEELAKVHSQDETSKAQGGKLEPFAKGEMVEPFEQAAWELTPGSFTPTPVQTPYGWHLIKRGKTLPAGVKPFAEARSIFEPRLLEEMRQKTLQTWLQRQRQGTEIEINPALEAKADKPSASAPPSTATPAPLTPSPASS
ncbi:MAG: hypothetical protein CVV27_08355 [Candidatus Melainabacteria bacterium HGW-Melainabacteria-1]|nr:MAG: hypothetical protein CVV27_08355 [Candidatus Melainabacteria bacterium HGW-Melainabacteria-1]